MANRVFEGPIALHRGTAAAFTTNNPVLIQGELGVELDTLKFKFGDGSTAWNALPYASGAIPVVSASAPNATNNNYELGQLWIKTGTNDAYIMVAGSHGTAVWVKMVTPSDLSALGGGDMLESVYATNGAAGKVDVAVMADKLTSAKSITLTNDVTGTVSSDLSSNVSITATLKNTGTAGTYEKVTTDAQGRVTAGDHLTAADIPTLTLSKISDAGTAASKDVGTASGNVPILDTAGKLASSVLPSIAVMNRFDVANTAALVGLTTAQIGDIGVLPNGTVYMLVHSDPTDAANWVHITLDPSAVTSVNGQAGPTVVLTTTDVAEGSNLYYTNARADARIAAAHAADLADGANIHMSTDTYAWDGGLET